jgi:hypothetical protein
MYVCVYEYILTAKPEQTGRGEGGGRQTHIATLQRQNHKQSSSWILPTVAILSFTTCVEGAWMVGVRGREGGGEGGRVLE